VQQWSIDIGAFKIMNILLNHKYQKVKEAAISAISSLVRGENFEAKRNFIDIDGVEFLLEMLNNE